MRKVHLISVTEPLLFDLALAIHQKGYEVSVSGVGLTDTTLARLEKEGCTCHGDGWFPERLTKDIHFVVLGASVRQDNPELIRAKELGLLVLSIPEFIFQRTKDDHLDDCVRPETAETGVRLCVDQRSPLVARSCASEL